MDERTIIVKLWLEMDVDTQLERLREREGDPQKRWKITDDDRKARERWDAHTEAIDEMLVRTSTDHAPWMVIGSRDKNHSEIRTMNTIAQAVERGFGSIFRTMITKAVNISSQRSDCPHYHLNKQYIHES